MIGLTFSTLAALDAPLDDVEVLDDADDLALRDAIDDAGELALGDFDAAGDLDTAVASEALDEVDLGDSGASA